MDALTQLKRAIEAKTAEREQRYRNLLATLADGAVMDVDAIESEALACGRSLDRVPADVSAFQRQRVLDRDRAQQRVDNLRKRLRDAEKHAEDRREKVIELVDND